MTESFALPQTDLWSFRTRPEAIFRAALAASRAARTSIADESHVAARAMQDAQWPT